MRRYIPEIGKAVNFPDGTTEEEIRRQVDEYLGRNKKDDGIDALDALKSGWSSGWGDAKDSAADYMDLVGLDDQANQIRDNIARSQKDQFVPQGFVEKLLSVVGSAPGALVGMAPAVGAGAAVTAMTANPIAGAAAGFGLHGAVRGGDGDLMSMDALKEGAISAVEGAAFGGLGKLGRLGQGAAMAGVGAGGGAARSIAAGEDVNAKEVASQAAVMGLLGLALGKSKPKAITDTEARTALSRKTYEELGRKAADDATLVSKKPPSDPMNLGLMDIEAARWVDDMVTQGKINFPEKVTHEQQLKIAHKLRQDALDQGRPDIARKIVLDRFDLFEKTWGGGKMGGEQLLVMEEFSSAGKEARKLWSEIEAAKSSGNAPMVAELTAKYDQVAQEAVALAGASQGFGTIVARTLNARNAMRHDLPLQEQAILMMKKKNKLDTETFNKLMSAVTDDEIRAITKTAWTPTFGDKTYEMWMMSMLSNPLTFGPTGVNTVSNLAKDLLLKYPVKTVQAVVEPYMAKRAGREAGYSFKTLADDIMVDLAEAGPSLRRWKHDLFHEKQGLSSKLELTHGNAIGGQPGASAAEKALGYVTRIPGRFLESTDQFFRGKAESAEALRIATERYGRAASFKERRKMAKHIIDNPTLKENREALKRIKAAGDEAVFTQSLQGQSEYSAIAKLANVAQNLKQNENPLISIPAKVIVPFTRTPANIAIDALKHSPFGIREYRRLKTLLKSQEDGRDSLVKSLLESGDAAGAAKAAATPTAVLHRDLSEQIAKSVIGTTMMSWALYESLNGNITGGGPIEYNDYQKWLEAGYQPYSMKLGDKWVSYQRIEPFASLLGLAADVAETGQAPPDEAFDRALAAVKDNIANKTFLLGVENLAKAWAAPKRYGTSMAKSLASTVVPAGAFLGSVARADDPVQRITTGQNFGDSVVKAIQGRIPGARKGLEARHSVTGHPVVDEYAEVNAFTPFRIADTTPVTIVDQEIDRLGRMGYQVPNMQRRKRTVKGEQRPVAATAEEYSTFNQYNKKASDVLERIMSTPSWSKMSPDAQSKIIMDVYGKFSKYSSKIVRRDMYQNRN